MAKSSGDSFVHPAPLWADEVPRDVLEMYAVYAAGATVAEVAARFGRDPKRVRALFDGCGLAVRGGPSRRKLQLPPERPPEEPAPQEPSAEERRGRRERARNERRKLARREQREARNRQRRARIEAMYT